MFAQYILDFIKTRKWDNVFCQCQIFDKLASAGCWLEYKGIKDKNHLTGLVKIFQKVMQPCFFMMIFYAPRGSAYGDSHLRYTQQENSILSMTMKNLKAMKRMMK